jgi:hypothetical protein
VGEALATAQALYDSALALSDTSSVNAVNAAIAAWNEAEAAYSELLLQTLLPLTGQSYINRVDAAREGALESGAALSFSSEFTLVDNLALALLDEYEGFIEVGAGLDHISAYMEMADRAEALERAYQALREGQGALLALQEIEENQLIPYADLSHADSSALAAWSAFAAALQSYSDSFTQGGSDYLSHAEEGLGQAMAAKVAYTEALDKAWKAYVGEKRAAALASRNEALANKANNACKVEFNAADARFNNGEYALTRLLYDIAGPSYEEAEAGFRAASALAIEKRRLAEEAINKADQSAVRSADTIREAAAILGEPEQDEENEMNEENNEELEEESEVNN